MQSPADSTPEPSTMPRDVASAYLVTLSRVGSWVIVSALVYRMMGASAFAMLTLVRSTIGILNFVTAGIGPAMVYHVAKSSAEVREAIPVPTEAPEAGRVLSYAGPRMDALAPPRGTPMQRLYFTAICTALMLAALGLVLTLVYAGNFDKWLTVTGGLRHEIGALVLLMGIGVLLRLVSDASGAVIQVQGRIAADNVLLAGSEILWVVLCAFWISDVPDDLPWVGGAYTVSGAALCLARFVAAEPCVRLLLSNVAFDGGAFRQMLGFGSLVVLSQLAGYLYAPTDYVLINKLLGADVVAVYAPAVQIDAGLLLLVSGLAAVLLPKSALAHAAGEVGRVKQYYLRGTLVSAALLVGAGVVVWLLSPWIFKLWLGDEMLATQRILPLILIHTTIGGSAMVGRSILLAMGKVGAYTTAALSAALLNVVISFCAVKYFGLGLNGIILGTIIAAVLSNGIWLPWYVMRTLNADGEPRRHEGHEGHEGHEESTKKQKNV